MTKQNALFNEKLNFLINFGSVQINLHNVVSAAVIYNVAYNLFECLIHSDKPQSLS